MDSQLSDFKTIANECLSKLNNGFNLTEVDESESMLFFSNGSVTFSVGCSATRDGNKWNIWSANDALLPFLSPVIDWLESRREKSLSKVIEKTCTALNQFRNGDKDAEAEGDKEDDDDKGMVAKGDEETDEDEDMEAKGEEEDDDDEDDDENDDDFGIDDAYYEDEDNDALNEVTSMEEDKDKEEYFFQQSSANKSAVSRLRQDLKAFKKSEGEYGVVGEPRADNLFLWDVKLTNFDEKSPLGKDLELFAKKSNREPVIYMELQFPPDYPMAPPFARIIRPRFQFLTGHVTIGGSICMQMLTKSGWIPTNDIESLLVQIRSEIMSDPNARLDQNPDREYDLHGAQDAFNRTVKKYGWDM